MIPTLPALWRRAGNAAIEFQALVLPLDEGDAGTVVRPGVRVWPAAELSAALGAVASTSPVQAVSAELLDEYLLALLPDGEFRATDRVRLDTFRRTGPEWVLGFAIERRIETDLDPAPARLCVLLRLAVGLGQAPRGLRFDFVLQASDDPTEVALPSLRLDLT